MKCNMIVNALNGIVIIFQQFADTVEEILPVELLSHSYCKCYTYYTISVIITQCNTSELYCTQMGYGIQYLAS